MVKTLIYDEFHRMSDQVTNHAERQRRYRQGLFVMTPKGAWDITERFNERFDTQVGGHSKLVKQWLDENGDVQSNLLLTMDGMASLPSIEKPPVIIDYQHGGIAYSLDEAEKKGGEFAAVVARLKERIAQYKAIKPVSQVN